MLNGVMAVTEENQEANHCVFEFDRISRVDTMSQSKLSSHKYSKNEILEYINGTTSIEVSQS